MAKRSFFKKAKRRARGLFSSRKSRRSGGSDNLMVELFSAMAYGAVRQNAAQLVQPLSQYLPLGGLNDEATLAALAYVGYRWGPPMLRKPMKAVLLTEAALAGSSLRAGINTGAATSGGGLQPSVAV